MNAICTLYNQNTFLIWVLLIISAIGLLEILGKFISIARSKRVISDYLKHLQSIYGYLEGAKSVSEVQDDYGYVMSYYDEMLDCLSQHFESLMHFYFGVYNRTADADEQKLRISQIFHDVNREEYLYEKQAKKYLLYFLCPTLKLYRGLCVLFRVLTIPIRKFKADFDQGQKIEISVSLIVEVLSLVRVCIELYNILH